MLFRCGLPKASLSPKHDRSQGDPETQSPHVGSVRTSGDPRAPRCLEDIMERLPVWADILLRERRGIRAATKKPRSTKRVEQMKKTVSEKQCLILIAHGSRDPRWRGTFECLQMSLEPKAGGRVRLAYMEFVGPTLTDVADACVEEGATHLRILPLFMAGGAHVATDIPEQIGVVQAKHPHVTIQLLPPIGEDLRMFNLMQEIILEHAGAPQPNSGVSAA